MHISIDWCSVVYHIYQAQEKAAIKAWEMTAMPPVLPEREECDRVLSADSELQGLCNDSFVFIDTTLGLPERVSMPPIDK